jgi:uncharacterized membrane protein YeaQ/YmgE (transglycosylase-associated protein family)
MSILAWIVLGLIAGFIGSKLVNKTGEGVFLDIVLGIVGAVVGGWVFSMFGAHGVTGINLYSLNCCCDWGCAGLGRLSRRAGRTSTGVMLGDGARPRATSSLPFFRSRLGCFSRGCSIRGSGRVPLSKFKFALEDRRVKFALQRRP